MQVEFAHSLRSGVLEEWEERRKRMKEKVKKKKKNKRGAHTHCTLQASSKKGEKGRLFIDWVPFGLSFRFSSLLLSFLFGLCRIGSEGGKERAKSKVKSHVSGNQQSLISVSPRSLAQ